jgi:hypothetical protein
MSSMLELKNSIDAWMSEFRSTLDAWEAWLARAEEAYVTGEFAILLEIEPAGDSIRLQMVEAHQQRDEIIGRAYQLGFSGISMTALVRWLGAEASPSWLRQLEDLGLQLKRTNQFSTSLWLTGFQAKAYTTSILELISTGSPERATYGGSDNHSELAGGRLMDAAA